MIKLQFLGTCAGIPSKERNVSSLIVQMLQHENECWLFDCGEATQHQLLYSSITLSKITKIFITHLHGDHIYGLPGLIASRSFQGATSKLQLFGPKGLKDFIHISLSTSNTYIKYPLEIQEIEEGMLYKSPLFTFEAIKLEHGIPSYGYRITEKGSQGALDIKKLEMLGIKPGPIFKELKAGKKVVLDSGVIIDGNDYLGPTKKGKIIAIAGDTRKCESIKKLAENANLFIHEATFLHEDYQLAYEHFHSTAFEAAQAAIECNVSILFLNHISSRYSKNSNQLLQEAQSIFPKTFIANDLQAFIINQKDEVNLLN